MLGLSLSVLLLGAPAHTPALPGDLRVDMRPIVRVWLRSPELDTDVLAAAVGARLADKQIFTVGASAGPQDGLAALCHVTLHADSLQLEVILSDGRLYQRTIAVKAEGRERAAARLIASTLAAIEDASATPDRRDGVFALPVAETHDAMIPPSPAPPVTTDVDMPAPPSATPQDAPPEPAHTVPTPRPEPAPTRPEPAALELGVALESGAGFGLGAPDAGRGLAAGGGGLRIDLRLRRGVTLGAGFRGHTRLREALALGRFRGALLVGHVLRRRNFELSLLAGPTLETWQVTQRGAPVVYTTTSSSGPSLLLGGLARVALGGRVQRPRLSARIGGYLEFAGSARSSGRAAQIGRNNDQGAAIPVFVLGGAELSVGVEVELWFKLRRRVPRS